MRREPRYPFVPKSTASLRVGQFWAIPLNSGRYGCGRVLQLDAEEIPSKRRAFFGGLHDWVGDAPPSELAIAGAGFLDFGVMHIKAITSSGGEILGIRPLELDAVELPILLSARGGAGAMILRGAEHVREAKPEEWGVLPTLRIWAYGVITLLGNSRLG